MATIAQPQQFIDSLPDHVRIEGNMEKRQVTVNGRALSIKASQRVKYFTERFTWGDTSNGTSQLSLAILMLFADDDTAWKYFAYFKRGWAALLPKENFIRVVSLKQVMGDILLEEENKIG